MAKIRHHDHIHIEMDVSKITESFRRISESVEGAALSFSEAAGRLSKLQPAEPLEIRWSEPFVETTQVVGYLQDDIPRWKPADKNSLLARIAPSMWPYAQIGWSLGLNDTWVSQDYTLFDVSVEFSFGHADQGPPWPSGSREGAYMLHLGEGSFARLTLISVVKSEELTGISGADSQT